MPTFIMLTQVSPEAIRSTQSLDVLERLAMKAVRDECPNVEWLASFAVLGPYDYLDVFTAPDFESAARVATLVRIAGHARTEVWGAVEWPRFKAMIRELPEVTGLVTVAR